MQGQRVAWQERVLTADETVGPAFEELIFIHVLGLVDPRLPAHVADLYRNRAGHLMDYRHTFFMAVAVYSGYGSESSTSDNIRIRIQAFHDKENLTKFF